MGSDEGKKLVFEIEAELVPKLNAWIHDIDEKVAREQVRTGTLKDRVRLPEAILRVVSDSLEHGEPLPYYGAIDGAYTYSFSPTSLGCVVKVRNTVTGDEIDLTDYSHW